MPAIQTLNGCRKTKFDATVKREDKDLLNDHDTESKGYDLRRFLRGIS